VEIIVGWKEVHDEKLHNLYYTPNIITVIKSRIMRWAGLVTYRRDLKH
jgi:hypothetical protein